MNGDESPDGDQPFREDWIYGELAAPSGEMKISIPGTLAIGSNLGPAAFYTSTISLQNGVTCMVKQAPVGADLVISGLCRNHAALYGDDRGRLHDRVRYRHALDRPGDAGHH